MEKRTKLVFIFFIISFGLIYSAIAIEEIASQSSKTVDQAFERFINNEFKTEVAYKLIGEKEFYRIGEYTFVPFEVGEHVFLVQFKEGMFGWKQGYYSRNRNEGYSYSSIVDHSNGYTLMHGVIPKDIITETRSIKVNGEDADIVMLNDKSGVWIMMNKLDQAYFNHVKIEFLDDVGNVIAEM